MLTGDWPHRLRMILWMYLIRLTLPAIVITENNIPDWDRAVMRFLGPITQQIRHPGSRQFYLSD